MKSWDGKGIEAKIFMCKRGKNIVKEIHGVNFSNLLWKDGIVVQFEVVLSQTLEMCHECMCGSFGHRKLVSGPNKHEAIPLQIQLNAGKFYLCLKKWSVSNRLV